MAQAGIFAVPNRLAYLIAASAILHAMALAPLKARRSVTAQLFAPALTVDLPARDSSPVAPRPPLDAAPEHAPVAARPIAAPTAMPQAAEIPAAPNRTTDSGVSRDAPPPQPPQPMANPLSGSSTPSPNPAPQAKDGVRIAMADEVSVNVRLLSYEGGSKPNETITVDGTRYIYFKSPTLAQAARPLEDAKAHYPAEKPEYIHGAVILQLLIDEEGRMERAVVVCSNPKFEKSAIASIQNMRFAPARDAKGPVKSYMTVEFGYGRGFPCASVPD